jgi:hypothetical protein
MSWIHRKQQRKGRWYRVDECCVVIWALSIQRGRWCLAMYRMFSLLNTRKPVRHGVCNSYNHIHDMPRLDQPC